MIYEIEISTTAREDLLNISNFLMDRFGMITASTYVSGVEDTFSILRKQPHIGVIYKGKVRRFIFKKKTVMFFTIDETTINIIRVFDTRQDWLSFF